MGAKKHLATIGMLFFYFLFFDSILMHLEVQNLM